MLHADAHTKGALTVHAHHSMAPRWRSCAQRGASDVGEAISLLRCGAWRVRVYVCQLISAVLWQRSRNRLRMHMQERLLR